MAFDGCSKLENVVISTGVTSIGGYAFNSCIGLKNIIIPNSITSIGNLAFCDCTDLTSVTIGKGVTSIEKWAFMGCTGLTSINYTDTKEKWNAIMKGEKWDGNTGNYTIRCTDGDISK